MEEDLIRNMGDHPELLTEIGKLLRRIGQYYYFNEAIPALLNDFAADMGISTESEKYRNVSEILWLSGWYWIDHMDNKAFNESSAYIPLTEDIVRESGTS